MTEYEQRAVEEAADKIAGHAAGLPLANGAALAVEFVIRVAKRVLEVHVPGAERELYWGLLDEIDRVLGEGDYAGEPRGTSGAD